MDPGRGKKNIKYQNDANNEVARKSQNATFSGFSISKCFLAVIILKRFLLAGLIEQRDSQPLLKLMESVGDWPVAFEDWNSTMGKSYLSCLQFAFNCCPLAACARGRGRMVLLLVLLVTEGSSAKRSGVEF